MTDGLVILAEFDLDPEKVDPFVGLVQANAVASVRDEPGCWRFDVLVPEVSPQAAGSSRIVLYEIYRDPAAFEAHLLTPLQGFPGCYGRTGCRSCNSPFRFAREREKRLNQGDIHGQGTVVQTLVEGAHPLRCCA